MTHFRHAAIALALLAGTGAAYAQTTVITQAPPPDAAVTVPQATVVTPAPLQLTPEQRHIVYRGVARASVPPAPGSVEYRVGVRVPGGVRLYPMPQPVAVEVPAVQPYKYMEVNGEVVLVDPATSEVVAELSD